MSNNNDPEMYPRISIRVSPILLREIDTAWLKRSEKDKSLSNRSKGVKWLLRRGIEAFRDDQVKGFDDYHHFDRDDPVELEDDDDDG